MIKSLLRKNRTAIYWAAFIVVLALVGLTVWYKNIYSDPRRVFNAMLENSLRTSSATKEVIQEDPSQSLNQVVNVQVGEQHVAQSRTRLVQKGIASALVVTQSVGTPTSDFVRYRSIQTDQKSVSGGDLDFSKVLGVWGKTSAEGTTSGQLYSESVLSVIPVGNLSAQNRSELLALATKLDVYKVEYYRVKAGKVNGRPAYEYKVKVSPAEYVELLTTYASMVGLTQLKDINPQNYENSSPIEFTVKVDIRTRRLAEIVFGNGRQEKYISYGGRKDVKTPKDFVTVDELQQKIQEVQ